MKKFDIFISYNWDIKPSVIKLYQALTTKYNFRVWMDEYEMGQTRLVDELSTAISNSELFLCCITKKYSESENCKDEMDYAKNLKKKFIVLMFERIPMDDLGGVGFIIGPKVRFNCYKEPAMFNEWSGSTFDSIIEAIKDNLNASSEMGSSGNEKDSLSINEILEEDKYLVCTSKNYFALVQKDGNFVVYKSDSFKRDRPLWASNTQNSQSPKPFSLILSQNGELILRDRNQKPIWTSNSANKGSREGYHLVMQNDGNLVLYDKVKNPIWATNTWNN